MSQRAIAPRSSSRRPDFNITAAPRMPSEDPRPGPSNEQPIERITVSIDFIGTMYRLTPAHCFPLFATSTLQVPYSSRVDNFGRTYYADSVRRTTSWERPPVLIPDHLREMVAATIAPFEEMALERHVGGSVCHTFSLNAFEQGDRQFWANRLNDLNASPPQLIPPYYAATPRERGIAEAIQRMIITLSGQVFPIHARRLNLPPYLESELPAYTPAQFVSQRDRRDSQVMSNRRQRALLEPDQRESRNLDRRLERSSSSEEEQAQRRNRERQAEEQRRRVESEEEREQRLSDRREDANRRRQQETPEQAAARVAAVQARANRPRYFNSAFSYDPTVAYRTLRGLDIGELNKICRNCGARTYPSESAGFCCSSGKVRVPIVDQPPPEISVLFTRDQPSHIDFMRRIVHYNRVFGMTSFGCTRDARMPGWSPTFRIQGQVYHRIGALLPQDDRPPAFIQVYFMDGEDALSRRMQLGGDDSPDLNHSTLRLLQEFLTTSNQLVARFKTTIENLPPDAERLLLRSDRVPQGEHPGRYNAPTGSETSILIVNADRADNREVVLYLRSGGLQRISEMHPSYDALQYPLIFWRGQETYTFNSIRLNTGANRVSYVSTRQYYCYLLQIREVNQNFLLTCGSLLNQFVVDVWAKAEAERLRFIRTHQTELRADEYIHLRDAVEADGQDADVGQRVILPSSFIGGPRNMKEYIQDAMALVRTYGRPDLFITMTCNPHWDEIKREMLENQPVTERYDIVSRVFHLKVTKLLEVLKKHQIFGPVNAWMYSIEWQKRGLPHIHLLVFLQDKMRPEQIDSVISAEIPSPVDDPELHMLIKTHMIHGPCGRINPNQVCMQPPVGQPFGSKNCIKTYPRPFVTATRTSEDGYPTYRRRSPEEGGHVIEQTVGQRSYTIDNTWIVPYCPVLMRMFSTHMNVEFCHSVKAIKYIFKYIHKGSDMAVIQTEAASRRDAPQIGHAERDEVTSYEVARYISSSEAFWKFFKFPIHGRHPSIQHLDVHLENGQQVYFRPDNMHEVVARGGRKTTLLGFFELCNRDPAGTANLLYADVPRYYTWNATRGTFQPRVRNIFQVGRLYTVHPNRAECFYLRLLLTRRTGPKGFRDLRTVDGIEHPTYREACLALGLLESDSHWADALEEACTDKQPAACRLLFAIILTNCQPSDPLELWNRFKDRLSEDIFHEYRARGVPATPDEVHNRCLIRLEDITLQMTGQSFGDGENDINLPATNRDAPDRLNPEIARECAFDRARLQQFCEEQLMLLTGEQKFVYERVVTSIEREEARIFFLDAPGGTGKTFLINLILAKIRSCGKIILACASSGVAATLMEGGRTAHSTFSIPIKHKPVPICNVRRGSNKAQLLRECVAIIWDECTMSNKKDMEAVDRTLQDIRGNNALFGGLVVLLAGDFRQTLPVIQKGTPADAIEASIKQSVLWRNVIKLNLTTNMRVHLHNEPGAAAFCERLLRIGNGTHPVLPNGHIQFRIDFCNLVGDINMLIESVFPDLANNLANHDWLRERAILASLNDSVDEINHKIQVGLPSNRTSRRYYSIDQTIDREQSINFPVEFLNTLRITNFPQHQLDLRVGSPIMLLRNMQPPKLCNGTRLCVADLRPNLIVADILTGPGRGERVYIPRIQLITDDDYIVKFKRRQFPVRLAYAMTINKAQGQSLKVAGLDFTAPCFSHGQLYVACSRVGKPANLFVLAREGKTMNVVYQQALL